jgi:hypothetical protein
VTTPHKGITFFLSLIISNYYSNQGEKRRQEKHKNVFPFQDTNKNCRQRIKSFFHCQNTHTTQTGITNKKKCFSIARIPNNADKKNTKTFFHSRIQIKIADRESNRFSIARIPIQRRQE